MNLLQIRYFLSIAECGNFTKTAERFFISQPAVSNQVALLEEELGVRLFKRNKRDVALTPAGRIWRDFFTEVLEKGASVKRQARQVEADETSVLYIAIQEHQCIQEVFDAIADFREDYPQIRVSVMVLSPADYYSRIDVSQFGIVIAPHSILSTYDNIRFAHSFPVERVIILSSHHPLAGKADLSIRDLMNETWLFPEQCFSDRAWNEKKIEEVFLARGLPEPIYMSIPSIDTLMAAVRAGIGVTIVPRSLLSYNSSGYHVVATGEYEEVSVAVPCHNDMPGTEAFLDVLLQHLPPAPV